MIVNQSVDYLGKKVKDKISGKKGIVTSVCFDLYGCIQVIIFEQKLDKDGNPRTFGWVDINRIDILKEKRIMDFPDFDQKYKSIKSINGPADKPILGAEE